MFSLRLSVGFALLFGLATISVGQTTPPTATPQTTSPAPSIPQGEDQPAPKGEVLIQSHGAPPSSGPGSGAVAPASSAPERTPDPKARVDLSDAERAAVEILSYNLDARLQPARSGLTMRAQVQVRNSGSVPLRQLALQISSSLRWESATLVADGRRTKLALAQHHLQTDADHTGAATEAVLPLPEPLPAGATATLDLFYSGTVSQDGNRLAQLGASASQQRESDWDGISSTWTGLRGFGDVLWYPVASPQLFLHEGNTLFLEVARTRQQDTSVEARLRLAVEYAGEPPVAAYFCGRRAELKAAPDDPGVPRAVGTGIATAEFTAEPLGFRIPSLFILNERETLLGGGGQGSSGLSTVSTGSTAPPASSSSLDEGPFAERPALAAPASTPVAAPGHPLVALLSTDNGVNAGLAQAADQSAGLLVPWLGPEPLSVLTVLDHPGQPFQDGPLLVAPAAILETSPERPALVYSLTHAWVQTGQPWMDEGLAQFFALLWVERDQGRSAAMAALQDLLQPVALAEPNLSSKEDVPTGQPVITAADELFYRRKAAAIWFMLRDLVGEDALGTTLKAWRMQGASQQSATTQAQNFERLLEKNCGKDLSWFFRDWVFADRGLPDLSIQGAEVSQTPAGAGQSAGWLVAVTVRNDGGAIADVPVTVRSRGLGTIVRMRVPGFSEVTQRIVTEALPTAVDVNDGSVPELRAATHTHPLLQAPAH